MKTRSVARCQSCGAETPRWVGRCPECGQWGSVVEEPVAPKSSRPPLGAAPEPAPLADLDEGRAARVPTGIEEIDRVLGGGLVAGSIVLLAGEPGVGKSTLTLQMAVSLAKTQDVLLVCGEESPQQVRSRASRLGPVPRNVATLADTDVGVILAAAERHRGTIVVDSVQTVYDPEIGSAPGSVAQVRECGARLARTAREREIALVLVGHVTKDGSVAGPRVLEHLVDVVLMFEGESQGDVRVLRAQKNRIGPQETGFFRMASEGLVPIRDASRYLLADRCPGEPGSVLAACVEGRRPFVLEIQALVADTSVAMPRRTAIGVDASRLPLLVAVIERRLHLPLGHKDVYVSAVGGIRATEPAADLPIALAIVSAFRNAALPEDLVAFGEVGLAGEVRRVPAADRRLAEARAVSCRRALIPYGSGPAGAGIDLEPIRHLRDAVKLLAKRKPVQEAD